MARVTIMPMAQRQLAQLITTRALPDEAVTRVERSIGRLAAQPHIGPALRGERARYRYLRGPWRWMAIVYRVDQANDHVIVVAIQDTRSADAWTAER